MIILQQHYKSTITSLQNTPWNPIAFQIATGWAQKRYGSRFHTDTVHTAKHTLQNTTPTATPAASPPPPGRALSRQPHPPPPLSEDEYPHLRRTQTPNRSSLSLGPRPSLAEAVSQYQRRHPSSQSTNLLRPPSTANSRDNPSSHHNPGQPPLGPFQIPLRGPGLPWPRPPPLLPNPPLLPTPSIQQYPLPQRTPGIRLPNQNPIPSKPTSPITSVATIPATTDQNSSLPGATLPSTSPIPQPSPPPQGFPSNRQITNEVHHSNVSYPLLPYPSSRSLFFKPTSSTSPTQYHPITHMARPQKKAQDWSLAGSKPIRILGDSNINHIPPHTNPTLQLDCYPGAKVYHFMELFKRTPPIPTAKIVIISIDINNKDDDPERTTTKQLNSMKKYAAKTFPRASIYIPFINHSPHDREELQRDLHQYHRRLKIIDYFHTKPCTQQSLFTFPSNWEPLITQVNDKTKHYH
nr:verprolin-like [Pseudochaenichthys georgianus]